ncbi:MAG: methyl-accepting chemotaxis protein, partial [Actinomycetales bacterium]
IGEISGIIARINDYQTTIASAVEEQTATTNEMNRSVGEAATGSAEIAANIGDMAHAITVAAANVAEASVSASDVATTAGELQTLVSRFTY